MASELDSILKRLPLANIAFNAPDTVGIGDPELVQLRLSGRKTVRQLKNEIDALGRREGARIRVSEQMEARLSGVGFEIEAITPEAQAVALEGVTAWDWEIEATKTGTRRLHLTLTALVEVSGSPSKHTIRTFDRVLKVRVSWRERVSGFVADNWQWLWTAILIPIVGWVLNKRTNRKGRKPKRRKRKLQVSGR